jgi:hypothetical protein
MSDMDPKSLDPEMVRFCRWCAGYFSWVDPSERMPTDENDLLRMMRDAFGAGANHSAHDEAQRAIVGLRSTLRDVFEYVQHEDGRTLIRAALMVTAPLVPDPKPVP